MDCQTWFTHYTICKPTRFHLKILAVKLNSIPPIVWAPRVQIQLHSFFMASYNDSPYFHFCLQLKGRLLQSLSLYQLLKQSHSPTDVICNSHSYQLPLLEEDWEGWTWETYPIPQKSLVTHSPLGIAERTEGVRGFRGGLPVGRCQGEKEIILGRGHFPPDSFRMQGQKSNANGSEGINDHNYLPITFSPI